MKKLVLACAVFAFAVHAVAGVNSWTASGPGGALVRRLAVSGQNRAIAFGGTEKGLFRSSDAGVTWTQLHPAFIFEFAVDPTNDAVLYIGAQEQLKRTTDGGATWTDVRAEHVDAVHVAHDGTVWASFGDSGLMRSSDRGASWQKPAALPPFVTGFASSPGALYVAAGRLFKTTSNGAAWTTAFDQAPVEAVAAVGDVVYVGGDAGVFRSTNGGQTWTPLTNLPAQDGLAELVVDPADGTRVLALFLGGAWVSEDAGATWRALSELSGLNAFAGAFTSNALLVGAQTGVLRSTDGQHFTASNSGLGGDEARFVHFGARMFLGTANNGLFVSDDRGATWRSVGPTLFSTAIAIDPTNAATVFLATGGAGLFRSTDGGNTFVPSGLSETINSVAVHGATVFAAKTEEVHRSTDGGTTWQVAYRSRFFANTRHVAIDPNAPNVAYATTTPVAVTLDGGSTWSETNVSSNFVRALLIVPGNPSQVFVGGPSIARATSGTTAFVNKSAGIPANTQIFDLTWNAATDTIYALVVPNTPGPGAIYTSRDRGETWRPYATQPPTSVVSIERIAAHANQIWIATFRGLYELTEVHQPRRRAVKK